MYSISSTLLLFALHLHVFLLLNIVEGFKLEKQQTKKITKPFKLYKKIIKTKTY